jgi:CrcB protein
VSHHALALLLIFLGGGIGSMLRHLVNQVSAAVFGVNFGWGTLLVNIVGSFAMGLLAGWFAFRSEGGELLRLFLATGILGGFTTFSAFSLDALLLWEKGQTTAALIYSVASVGGAIISVFAGSLAMRSWLS